MRRENSRKDFWQSLEAREGEYTHNFFKMGSAPASGAADRALAVGLCDEYGAPFGVRRAGRQRREGAPLDSRGGCAPRPRERGYRPQVRKGRITAVRRSL